MGRIGGVTFGRFDRRIGRRVLPASILGLIGLGAACGGVQVGGGSARAEAVADFMDAPSYRHTGFRIRLDAGAPLNSNDGWAGAPNEGATVSADRPFRLRFEVEAAGAGNGDAHRFRLQVRRNGGAWENVMAADFPYPDEIATPRVSIVEPAGYAGGSATEDLIAASRLPFRPGIGVGLDSLTGAWSGQGHGEWEWSVVIRNFADGAVMNEEGDSFEFRMADVSGRPMGRGPLPSVTLTVPPGLLGGTYVETPGRLGPWQSADGQLYFIMEPAETDNLLMVVGSSDGGATWREIDGANRPAADDLEGFATAFHAGVIHMLHQTSDAVWYHAFRTGDGRAGAGRWSVRDEPVATPGEPPTQVATFAVRDDGSLLGVYGDPTGLRYRIRSPQGVWSAERRIDAPPGTILSGPQVAAGNAGVVHLAYTARDDREGSVWTRKIGPDGGLGPAFRIAVGTGVREEDAGAVLPLVYLPETGTLVVLYRSSTAELWERRIGPDEAPIPPVLVTDLRVVQSPVDSDQVGADAIADGEDVHVLFIEEQTGDLFHVRRADERGWDPAVRVVEGIDAQWVRGNRIRRRDGSVVYAFVYDAGSDGGSGMNWYREVPLGTR